MIVTRWGRLLTRSLLLTVGFAFGACAEAEDLPGSGLDGGGGALSDVSVDGDVDAGGDADTDGSAGAAGSGGQAGMDGGQDSAADALSDAPVDTGLDVVTQPGLVGYWPFESTTGPVVDLSGQGNHGLVQGTGILRGSPGALGSSLGVSGGDGAVKVPNSTSLDFSAAATISFWVRLTSVSQGTIVSRGPATGTSVRVRTNVGNLQVYFTYAGSTASLITSTNVLDSQWRHVGIVNDGTTLSTYLNGNLLQSGPGGKLGSIFGDLLIGSMGTNDPAFNGFIDELKWWNVARTAQELCADSGGTWSAADGGTCS